MRNSQLTAYCCYRWKGCRSDSEITSTESIRRRTGCVDSVDNDKVIVCNTASSSNSTYSAHGSTQPKSAGACCCCCARRQAQFACSLLDIIKFLKNMEEYYNLVVFPLLTFATYISFKRNRTMKAFLKPGR